MATHFLLTGATGVFGRYLLPSLMQLGEVIGVAGPATSNEGIRRFDLADTVAVDHCLDEIAPVIILHAAAKTDVDACERYPGVAWKSNVLATRNLVGWCRRQKAAPYFVYLSTDQVYDGVGPHQENEPSPINVYALTKLWAEELVQQLPRHLILRLNYVALPLPDLRRGFVSWLIDSLSAGQPITLFDDVLFNPLYVVDAIELLIELVKMRVEGLINFGAGGEGISKAAYALALADQLGLPTKNARIGSVAQAISVAARPMDMRMDVSRLARQIGRYPPDVTSGLHRLTSDWESRNRHLKHA